MERSKGILDSTNFIWGGIIAVFMAIFGEMWFLFVGLIALNILDWISGWYYAAKNHESSSKIGAQGIAKKVGYWVIISVAFYIGYSFEQMGVLLDMPLQFTNGIGWFVLANYIINEIRSILENAVKLNIPVPIYLIKGLKITGDWMDGAAEKAFGKELQKQNTYENHT
jgi:toxin secretion/phage lysis holin